MQTILASLIVLAAMAYLAWEWMPAHWQFALRSGTMPAERTSASSMTPSAIARTACGSCSTCGACGKAPASR